MVNAETTDSSGHAIPSIVTLPILSSSHYCESLPQCRDVHVSIVTLNYVIALP